LVWKEANNSSDFAGVSRSRDAVFRHFDFGDSAEREEQFDQVLRGIFGSLAHNVADRGGYSRVEKDASGLQPGEIYTHCPTRLKGSHIAPRVELCATQLPIANLG